MLFPAIHKLVAEELGELRIGKDARIEDQPGFLTRLLENVCGCPPVVTVFGNEPLAVYVDNDPADKLRGRIETRGGVDSIHRSNRSAKLLRKRDSGAITVRAADRHAMIKQEAGVLRDHLSVHLETACCENNPSPGSDLDHFGKAADDDTADPSLFVGQELQHRAVAEDLNTCFGATRK